MLHDTLSRGTGSGTMTAGKTPITLTALLSAALAFAAQAEGGERDDAVAQAEDRLCVTAAASGRVERAGQSGGGANSAMNLTILESADPAFNAIAFGCSGNALTSIHISLPSGQQAEVTLLLGNPRSAALEFTADLWPDEPQTQAWLHMEPNSGTIPAGGQAQARLLFSAPADDLAQGGHEQLILFTTDDGTRESTTTVAVALEVGGEAPMFRDDFKVDPVLGQFSYLTR